MSIGLLAVSGDEVAIGDVVVVVSVVVASGEAAGEVVVVVSVFCSQAARSAAVAKRQMYFFIGFWIDSGY